MITPIEQITSIVPEARSAEKVDASGEQGAFGNIFRSPLKMSARRTRKKHRRQYLLATGQLDNPAALTIASTKNEIAVSLLVQLRNKALDAYSELTRISL